MDIVLITTRNIYEQTGEYKLIKRRAEELYKEFGIITKVISLQRKNRIEKCVFKSDKSFEYTECIGFEKNSFVIDVLKYRKVISEYLEINKPKIIISSGEASFYYDILKKYKLNNKCKLYTDVHGCNEELIEYSSGINKIKNKFIVGVLNKTLENMIKISDNILVVSRSMKEYINSELYNKHNNYFIIPCGNDNKLISSDIRLSKRNKWRRELGFKEDDIVVVYSGGVSKWQMIEPMIEVFEGIIGKSSKIKVCIFSGNLKRFDDFKNKYNDRVITKSLKNYEVIEALSACDIGFILRENNLTNIVAFPTKFAEYIEAGLNIVLSGVESQKDLINKFNLGIVIEDINSINVESINEKIDMIMKNRIDNIQNYYSICNYIIDETLNYKKNIELLGKDIIS